MNDVATVEPKMPAEQAEVTPTTSLEIVARAAVDPSVNVDKLERLMAMHERISEREAEIEFNAAMAEAQAKMTRVAADASNKQIQGNSRTNSRYASYAALDRHLRPIYSELGFALSFDSGDAPEGTVKVLCHVSHRGGHTRTYSAMMPADGKGAKGGDVMSKTHAVGSAFTYGQRYLLKMIFNVAVGTDDDGNAASGVITTEQKDELVMLLRETDSDTGKLLAVYGVASIDELLAANYGAAKAMLEQKRQKAGAA